MKHLVIFCFVTLFAYKASAQHRDVAASEAHHYNGKQAAIVGKVKYLAGPGYSSSIYYYIVTDSIEEGLSVEVPVSVWKLMPHALELQGRFMRVAGVVKLNHDQPYIVVQDTSEIQVLKP